MICVLCGFDNDLVTVGFKSECGGCGRYLHTCVQCAHYDGLSKRCRSLTTEAVRDREGCNFCEEFRPGGSGSPSGQREGSGKGTTRGASDFDALFGGGGDE